MICLRNNLPLVRLAGGEAVEFEHSWLVDSLSKAAADAGHTKWTSARDVAESVSLFLELDFEGTIISLEQITALISAALVTIGYEEVAQKLRIVAPPARISLDEIARDAGHSYELGFFDILRQRLDQAAMAHNANIEISNVRRGIKRLRRSQKWGVRCTRLLDEVIHFVRSAAKSLPQTHINIQVQ